ncbi:hypothetical protein [Streptomyces sp. NPDC002088]
MKNSREIMEVLEAYDLTGSYRAAAELAGLDHHTVYGDSKPPPSVRT